MAARLRGLLAIFLVGRGGKHRMRVCGLWFVDVPVSGTRDVSDGDVV